MSLWTSSWALIIGYRWFEPSAICGMLVFPLSIFKGSSQFRLCNWQLLLVLSPPRLFVLSCGVQLKYSQIFICLLYLNFTSIWNTFPSAYWQFRVVWSRKIVNASLLSVFFQNSSIASFYIQYGPFAMAGLVKKHKRAPFIRKLQLLPNVSSFMTAYGHLLQYLKRHEVKSSMAIWWRLISSVTTSSIIRAS